MKYSLKFKLKQIEIYKSGGILSFPKTCKKKSFRQKVVIWTKRYELFGMDGLRHNTKVISLDNKLNLIQRVINGESIASVALSANIGDSSLLKWYKIYLQKGIEGLKSLKRGRKSMSKKDRELKESVESKKSKSKFTDEEIEYILAENAYLKKLQALVQERNLKQQKK